MIDVHSWHWPQYTELALLFLSLATFAAKHGERRLDPDGGPIKYNFPMRVVGLLLTLFILTFGGFFGTTP